ncbi:ATP-binding cassette domain-containing protein [Streptosporangium sp. NBC_01755]|uniref:ATP-binding cassette domain-containing protein n=1 Tax=unclassified Streptosporangium TaxID=2632669 RepID=UPI002DD83F24|nr:MULTISPECIES: ATP-binding cassette domain-containing protein [unclassified Streptosporangium]WSA26764.1 ATP-binding cassette domain-containing protein [Streptosporangium sp. NBC_01810]WSD01811.1 ATP-binding cassette domain-containing protein [Streptosporangium sp. NBC_01755]
MTTENDRVALEVRDLRVGYGKAVALNLAGQALVVPTGGVTLLLGANGAGKSSLVNAAYGAVRSTGVVLLDGEDVSATSAVDRARRGMALVPQGRQLFPRMTVRENLQVMAEMLDLPDAAVERGIERFEPLRRGVNKSAGVLSGGEQQMLAISRALLNEPRVLLLDELSTGLAPVIVSELLDLLTGLAEEGVASLLTSPTSTRLLRYVDSGYVLVRGGVYAGPLAPDDLEAAYAEALGSVQRNVRDGSVAGHRI